MIKVPLIDRDPLYGWVMVFAVFMLGALSFGIMGSISAFLKPLSSEFMSHVNTVSHSLFKFKYWLEYGVLVFGGFVIYRWIILPFETPWHKIRHFRIKFQDAIVSLLLFLVLV